jgi:hypothetical protein
MARGKAAGKEESKTNGHPEVPQPVLRSDRRAQELWRRAHDRASRAYGVGARATRSAYDALKREYIKRGNRWVKRSEAGEAVGPAAPGLPAFVSMGQGLFYMATGVWSLVSRRTFEQVTGPKTDFWLVRTVGVLVTVIGAVLTYAGLRRRDELPDEVPLLAAGSAAGLAAIDFVYVARRRISPVYLLDAVAEIALFIIWAVAWLGRRSGDGAED